MEVIFRYPTKGDIRFPNTVTTDGSPNLPAIKDRVFIEGLWYVVTDREWFYEDSRVVIYVKRDYDIKYI